MLALPRDVALTCCRTGRAVQARLEKLSVRTAREKIDAFWWSHLPGSISQPERQDDHHWSWEQNVAHAMMHVYASAIAVLTGDGDVQAATTYIWDGDSVLERGKKAVHVKFIATAPWNRGWVVQEPRYSGAGTQLLVHATAHSYVLGLQGRINLFSLPRPATENFYRSRSFQPTGLVQDGMMCMELSSRHAQEWLRREGILR